jgi:hypothetical protein
MWNDENLEEITMSLNENEPKQVLGKRKRHIKDVDILGDFTNPIYDSYILNTLYDSDFVYDTDDEENDDGYCTLNELFNDDFEKESNLFKQRHGISFF